MIYYCCYYHSYSNQIKSNHLKFQKVDFDDFAFCKGIPERLVGDADPGVGGAGGILSGDNDDEFVCA
jgi:hypothetical protein